jgi:hypothetical protein
MVHTMVVAGGGKRQPRPPTNHFKKLLEETCPNHTYPVKQKLRDCGMMKNIMASGSLSWLMEVNEAPDEGDMMPFLREDAVMMIYDGSPTPGMHRGPNPSLGTLARIGCGYQSTGMSRHKFSNIFVH